MIQIPEQVSFIIHKLEESGFEAYAVGGCVRDTLLNRTPGDWDITTSALPAQVKTLFRRTIDTGIEHGTVTVMLGKEGFEVTTYRLDGVYCDGRHPSSVTFTPSLTKDLKRRDFTINAMAYHPGKGIVDCFNGMTDLELKIIRCVGDPEERFREDALRMLRAVRFAAQLGFSIEKNTRDAICRLAKNLRLISQERIQAELVKLLTSPHPDYIRIAYETGITAVVLPEFDRMMETPQHNPYHTLSVGEHTIASMLAVNPSSVLRLTMLFHDIGKPQCLRTDADGSTHFTNHASVGAKMAGEILRRLKFDNHTIEDVTALIRCHDNLRDCIDPSVTPALIRKKAIRRIINQIGNDRFPLLMEVNRADNLAKSDLARRQILPYLDMIQEAYEEIIADGDCLSLKDLAINGKDLMELGLKPGKEIGRILEFCLETVLAEPEKNNRDALTAAVKELMMNPLP